MPRRRNAALLFHGEDGVCRHKQGGLLPPLVLLLPLALLLAVHDGAVPVLKGERQRRMTPLNSVHACGGRFVRGCIYVPVGADSGNNPERQQLYIVAGCSVGGFL